MEIDIAQTADAALPYITAFVAAYGRDALAKVQDIAADKTSTAAAALGRRLLDRLLRRDQSRDSIEAAIVDVASEEADSDVALRLQIRKAMKEDHRLARDVSELISAFTVHVEASGPGAVASNVNNGIASTGTSAFNVGAQNNFGPGVFVGRDIRAEREEGDQTAS